MNYNQTEVWPFNLLCRVFDPEELQALKADPPADLNAFLVYVVREMYSNIDADVIILHYMGQMSPEGIAEMLKVSDEQIADILASAGEKLHDPLLKETFLKGLAWRVEHEKKEAYLAGYRRGYAYGLAPFFTSHLYDQGGKSCKHSAHTVMKSFPARKAVPAK